jgi:hypothetical protein
VVEGVSFVSCRFLLFLAVFLLALRDSLPRLAFIVAGVREFFVCFLIRLVDA